MAWGEAVLVRVGIVGSWWLMDDAIHALFASEAKRFMRMGNASDRAHERVRQLAQAASRVVEIGWRTGANLLQICRRWAVHRPG